MGEGGEGHAPPLLTVECFIKCLCYFADLLLEFQILINFFNVLY